MTLRFKTCRVFLGLFGRLNIISKLCSVHRIRIIFEISYFIQILESKPPCDYLEFYHFFCLSIFWIYLMTFYRMIFICFVNIFMILLSSTAFCIWCTEVTWLRVMDVLPNIWSKVIILLAKYHLITAPSPPSPVSSSNYHRYAAKLPCQLLSPQSPLQRPIWKNITNVKNGQTQKMIEILLIL